MERSKGDALRQAIAERGYRINCLVEPRIEEESEKVYSYSREVILDGELYSYKSCSENNFHDTFCDRNPAKILGARKVGEAVEITKNNKVVGEYNERTGIFLVLIGNRVVERRCSPTRVQVIKNVLKDRVN